MKESSSPRKNPTALDFKSATLYAVRVVLHSADTAALIAALDTRMKDAGAFFENEPVVVDASQVEGTIDWAALLASLKGHRLHPVGVVAEGDCLLAAQAAGLPAVDLANPVQRPKAEPASEADMPVVAPAQAQAQTQAQAEPAEAPAAAAAHEPAAPQLAPAAMVINRPLRSGQRIYARNTDLIVIGVVSQGAEVIADGNIHVYGPLRGKAMAGARGDTSARIFTTQLDPELLAIAGVYRVLETRMDKTLQNRPAIIQLDDDRLQINPLD
ncbi:septum site-determining protein MinC [Pusillimonas sp. TS35]|nr:septum site-determining protein MinC [Pusillimonas sp. TS35]